MRKILILLGVTSISMTACNRENKTADTQNMTTDTSATNTTATTTKADYEAEYQDRAQRLSQQMATDLKFDSATTTKVQQVYHNRERRLNGVRNKYNYSHDATVRTGGNANENTTNNADMLNEMQIIDGEVNGELRNILNPEQYKAYEVKKADYFATTPSQDNVKREITRDGDEITVKTGDIKVKAEPGKSKVETSTYESKIKGDERKFKSKTSDTKIKSEPGKAKYESGDTKIKVEQE